MSATGRNAPCPCGSGKKYKRCCGQAGLRPVGISDQDRANAWEKLVRFSRREDFRDAFGELQGRFWGVGEAAADPMEREEMESNPLIVVNLHSLFLFDFVVRDGRSPVEMFLGHHGEMLTPRERRYLEEMAGTHVGLFEILETRTGRELRLRDAWAGEGEFWAFDPRGQCDLQAGAYVATRILHGSSGMPRFEADYYPFDSPPFGKRVLAQLEEDWAAWLEAGHPSSRSLFLKRRAFRFHHFFLEHGPLGPGAGAVVFDGEPLLPITMRFSIQSPARLVRALDRCKELTAEDGDLWVLLREEGGAGHLVAEFRIRKTRLVVRAFARAHAQEARALLERIARADVRHLKTEHGDPVAFLADRRRVEKERASAGPSPTETARILEEGARAYYRRWMDEKVPALDGRTPRQAAADPAWRGRVVQLVESIETTKLPIPGGERRIDFGWLWRELELERPAPRPRNPYPFQEACLTHYLDRGDLSHEVPKEARRLGLYLGRIVAAASRNEPGGSVSTGIPCRRRPRSRPCRGTLVALREGEAGERILWQCPLCEDAGSIRDWCNTPFDIRDRPRGKCVEIDPKAERLLLGLHYLSAPALSLLAAAVPSQEGVQLEGSKEEYRAVARCLALEVVQDPGSRKRVQEMRELHALFARSSGEAPDLSMIALATELLLLEESRRRRLTPVSASGSEPSTLCLHVRLLDVVPMIWRRVEVSSRLSLEDLHPVLILAMGWADTHLHRFEKGARGWMAPEQRGRNKAEDARAVLLDALLGREGESLVWEYDFGDCWRHEIRVEEIAPVPCERPRLLAGERAAPPENCGGAPGYARLLDALRDPQRGEHRELLDWLGTPFDPAALDRNVHDGRLARLAESWRRRSGGRAARGRVH